MDTETVEIKWFGSRSYIDQQYADIYQNFFRLVDAKCMDDNMAALADEVDVIFTATPQGLCASLINEEILSKCKVIDLSADFRIKDVKNMRSGTGSSIRLRSLSRKLFMVSARSTVRILRMQADRQPGMLSDMLHTVYLSVVKGRPH